MTGPLHDPGVAGLAQLGRNAIERVSELERDLAAVNAERDELLERLSASDTWRKVAEKSNDQLRAELAEAVAERDRLHMRMTEQQVRDGLTIDTLRARLAEIDAALAKAGVA